MKEMNNTNTRFDNNIKWCMLDGASASVIGSVSNRKTNYFKRSE